MRMTAAGGKGQARRDARHPAILRAHEVQRAARRAQGSASFSLDWSRSRKMSESAAKEAAPLSGSREKTTMNREETKLNRWRDILEGWRAILNRRPYFLNRERAAMNR